jgi:hypothetical protein
MRKTKIFWGVLLSIIIISCLALWSCGGGGGEGSAPESNTPLTSANAPKAAAGIFKATDIAEPLKGVPGIITASSAENGGTATSSAISNLLDMTASALQSRTQSTNVHRAGSIPWPFTYTQACADGGDITLYNATWDGDAQPDDLSQLVNFRGQVTFNNCKKDTLTLNGSMTIAVQGALTSPTSMTMTTTLAYSDTGTNTTINLNNATVAISNIAPGLDLSNVTIVLSGGLSANLDGEIIEIRGNNFMLQFATIPGGVTLSLSGQIRTACLGTWLTITTATPITILSGDTCPTGGDVSASYGGNTDRVVINPDNIPGNKSINLYFNGTLVDTYDDCVALKGHCS